MKRISRLIISILLVAIFGVVMALVVSAAEPSLSIDYCNLSFRDNVCIKYAVASDSASEVKLLVWNAPQTEYNVGSQAATLKTVGKQEINGESYAIYDYCDLTAKQMPEFVYARAYTNVEGTDYYSDVVKYSILQYAYNKLGKTGTATTDTHLISVLNEMIEYGAAAQIYFDYKTDRLATSPFYQIKVVGGAIDDMSDHGLYLSGDAVTLIAPEADSNGTPFSGWVDSDGNAVSSTASCTVTVGTKNVTYTATYKKTSQGLEIESNGDGTCCLLSIGDCTDTDIVIPATYNGDVVTSIDSNAFSGEAITSITIPVSIIEIGRRAFNNCSELTDVYYEGSEAEWNEIDINSTGNSALTGANIHFAKVESFTVTFVDYNGTVIDTQSVEKGKAATAPSDPQRAGYTFVGWDKAFDNITSDITVTAKYEENTVTYTEPTFVVDNVTASAGETVEVTVNVAENPGILGMVISVEYDESVLTLTSSANGDALSALTFQKPSKYESGSNYVWYGSETGEVTDGSVLKLTFTVAENAYGTYPITVMYEDGSIYDAGYNSISLEVVNGSITVE